MSESRSLDPPTTFQEIFARLPWYWDLERSKYEMVMKKIAEEGWTWADVDGWKREQMEKKRRKMERKRICDRKWGRGL